MAFNIRPGGKAESVPVDAAVVSGDVIVVGNLAGIAEINAEEGRDGLFYTTLALEGVANATVSTAVTVGQVLYASGGAGGTAATVVTAASGNKAIGIATRAKTTGAGMAWFKLVPNVTAAAV